MPLVPRRSLVSFRASLSTPVSFYGPPHLGAYLAVPALMALLHKVKEPILFHSVPEESVLWQVMTAASGRFAVIERWKRAALYPEGSYETWFETTFTRKRRKEFRRLSARLSEQGRFEALTLNSADDAKAWTSEFLALEALGWKGRRGTAINTDKQAAEALHEGLAGLAAAGKLRFWKLALDGKPLAMMFAIVEQSQAWLGKIAHDEAFGRFSPGVLLTLHASEQLFAENVKQVDSCAAPDHPMIDHLWRQRLKVADVMVAAPGVSQTRFSIAVTGERLRRKLRALARGHYHRMAGRLHA
jgi:hypothetical protein